MKKILSAVLIGAMVLSLAACGSGRAPEMTMGTGDETGMYYAFGNVLGTYIRKETGIGMEVLSTEGSRANILGIDAGEYQLGMVQSDVMAYAWEGDRSFADTGKIDSFRVVAGMYTEVVQLITMDPEIKTVADLKGRVVSIGAPDSGVYFNAVDALAAAGLGGKDIQAEYQSFADSADALREGSIDAAFIVAGTPTAALTELCTTNKVFLIPIDGLVAEIMMENGPFYTAYTIPAGTYEGQAKDVDTVAVKATLAVAASASEEAVYRLTKAIFDHTASIAAESQKGEELSVENATGGMAVPFHAGAARYFAEKGAEVAVETLGEE